MAYAISTSRVQPRSSTTQRSMPFTGAPTTCRRGSSSMPPEPTEGGWTIFAVHDSKESWERFRDDVLVPTLQAGIEGGPEGPPERRPSSCTRPSASR